MKNQMAAVVTGGAAVFVLGASWFLASSLQSPSRKLDARVNEATERARRTLDKYSPTTDAAGIVAVETGVATDLNRDRISEFMNDDPRIAEDIIDENTSRLKAALDSNRARLNELEGKRSAIDPSSETARPGPVSFGQNVDAQVRTLAEGVEARLE